MMHPKGGEMMELDTGCSSDKSLQLVIYCLGALGRPVEREADIHRTLYFSSIAHPEIAKDTFAFIRQGNEPYSKAIDEALAEVRKRGYISVSGLDLSDDGCEAFGILDKRLEEPLKAVVSESKDFVSGLSDEELMTFIDVVFPDRDIADKKDATNLQDREKHAISMLQKWKITASLAARIAGMDYLEFESLLKDREIKWKS